MLRQGYELLRVSLSSLMFLYHIRLFPAIAVTGNEKYSNIGNGTAAKNVTSVQHNW